MAPKKQFALLTIRNTNAISVPPGRYTWARHPVLHDDTFWYNVVKGFTEAGTLFEDKSSNSSVESEGYWTLYPDNIEDKGVVIPPRSIMCMMVDKKEMPFSEVCFVNKAQQHEKFEEWAKNILAQPGMPTKLHNLGIIRSIT